MPGNKMREVADAARLRGMDPGAALDAEARRQGYTRGTEPAPPTRVYGEVGDEELERRRRMKAQTGRVLTQEDL